MRPWWFVGCALVFSLGCAGEKVVPVSGLITLDGKPLANAYVTFQPIGRSGSPNPGPGSSGKTDAQGRYTLQVVGRPDKGAVVGTHRVQIVAYEGELPPATNDSNPNLPR